MTGLVWLFVVMCVTSISLLGNVDSLHCFTCGNLTNDVDCRHVNQCAADEICYVERHNHGNSTKFTSGCRNSQRCPNQRPFSIVGRSAPDNCIECCSHDGCNKELCETKDIPAIKTPINCEDDTSTNCSRMSTLINICSNGQEAKTVCPKYCGLCNQVDGGWSVWGNWTACSTSCGIGAKTRKRMCSHPLPQHGVALCPGKSIQLHSCFDRTCPAQMIDRSGLSSYTIKCWHVSQTNAYYTTKLQCTMTVHGEWNNWGAWEGCSVPCGTGVRKRHRACNNPTPSLYGRFCLGDAVDFDLCTGHACGNTTTTIAPTTTQTQHCFDSSGDCSLLNQTLQICSSPQNARKVCQEFCGLCSIADGFWSGWSSWGTCSTTCGNGTWIKIRTCTSPAPSKEGKPCPGSNTDIGICNLRQCPVHGNWSPWGKWNKCSATCGQGFTNRRRTCTNPRPSFSGNYCFDDPLESAMCIVKKCPVDGGWSDWLLWSSCSVTCGAGQMTRQRLCINPRPENGGHDCTGSNLENKTCQPGPCPDNTIPTIVFNAYHLTTDSPSIGHTLTFKSVITNIGNGYNTTMGQFTAPVNGTYSFTVQFCISSGKYAEFSLVLDGNVVIRLQENDDAYSYSSPSSSIPLFLKKGQKVWVQSERTCSSCLYGNSGCWNRFSGSLVHK